MNSLKFLLALAVYCAVSQLEPVGAAYCNGKPDPNAKQNMNPVIIDKPVFVKQIKNAKRYTVASGDEQMDIVHLWGSPYEMGYAHGVISKDRMIGLVNTYWNYIENSIIDAVNSSVPGLFNPKFLEDVANYGLDIAFDLESLLTDKFTGQYFFDELKGMSDATGIDYQKLRRMHMVGELTKGTCSMFGAWGDALANPNELLQLRGLDWATDAGLQNFPEITIYHPTNTSNGHAFANIGWTGWIGSIMGYSSAKIGISEIGVYFTDDSYGNESRIGIPFTYLLRDILQFDDSMEEADERITNANRTCYLILGVGDGKTNRFNSVQYSYSVAAFMNDTNMRPVADWHPKIKDTTYYGKDWNCPGFNVVMAQQLQVLYGKLTAEAAIQNITSITQTGQLTAVYYDYARDNVFIANARGTGEKGELNAYDRAFVRVNMADLFNEQPPSF